MGVDVATWSVIAVTISATAAFFAALSSFLIWRIQRSNLLESVRPELVITGWGREQHGEGDNAYEVIKFTEVRNVGKGPALHVHMDCMHIENNFPQAVMSTARYPIIVQNETQEMKAEIIVYWKNVKEEDGGRFLFITITIFYWDVRDIRHETTYHLFVTNPPMFCAAAEELSPGVSLTTRQTMRVPGWRLKWKSRLLKWKEKWKDRLGRSWRRLKKIRKSPKGDQSDGQ
jgi:hypothetical protein